MRDGRSARRVVAFLSFAVAISCGCSAPSDSHYAEHILDVRTDMTTQEVERIAGTPSERKADHAGRPIWVYDGYDVHFERGRVSYVDPW